MKHETRTEYVTRAAAETFQWLTDRSANCHPIAYQRLDLVAEMLADYLTPKPTPNSETRLGKLTKADRAAALAKLEGFIWASRESK